MRLALAGRDLIQGFEKLALIGYADQGGLPTIGWGHTGRDVYVGETIDADMADALFQTDVASAVAAVNTGVTRPLTQNQFDALVAFTFNVGNKSFLNSTLLKQLNANNLPAVVGEFARWNKVGSTVSNGLVARRAAEISLFRKV